MELFCVGYLLLGMGLALKCGLYSQSEFLRKKLSFPLQVVIIFGVSFWLPYEGCVSALGPHLA